ncbi:hypothetical protein GWR56_11130 [Mucilaginibacter sp. 14171R-50]|uniref:hypothetical protein n=1 Tax=Mucilaginibacter sp. 14171R-50 TaxID=2703789 RepID=UPI00138B84CC|nr:hypothetical protein [Mucilaginibacter sp. 14171R-50]QHS56058.1 hypothetical protein GWR56_11130 [Mucilaginibacter sp. 14171R-50]
MSATYNWAYRPGVANKYGITIPAGADNVRPAGYCYIALFGSDISGNGSRLLPYKTFAKAYSVCGTVSYIFGSGVYREIISDPIVICIGDGDVIFNGTQLTSMEMMTCYNIKFVNWTNSFSNLHWPLTDVTFENCVNCFGSMTSFGQASRSWKNVTINSCTGILRIGNTSGLMVGYQNQVTFYNCSNLGIIGDDVLNNNINMIFHSCNIWFDKASCLSYSLFFNCRFAFAGARPTLSTGFTYYGAIADLRAAHLIAFPALVTNFIGCSIADPKFNNPTIGDFSLRFDSPAKNLSYFGTYVGARSIAQGLRVRAIEGDGDFDFSTAVNCTIADDSIIPTDPNIDAIIETKTIENTLGRQIKSIPLQYFNADRNGQYVDSIPDLDIITKAAGDTLTIPASYLVEGGSISYNSATYTAGQRFTTVTGHTNFTTGTSGVVREILEAPQRHTIEMKLSDVQPFTTEAFNHFEPGITPTTNNLGDSRTGAIIRGNGDPAFVRGATVEFPVNSRFIKLRFTIRVNNLKP